MVWTEEQRLRALERYAIVGSPSEDAFDDIAQLAAGVCETPIALVSFVDELRQWFKAVIGLPLRETPRAAAICASAMLCDDVFVVTDLSRDPRFAQNPLVASEPGLRFYAGAPVKTPDGIPLGTVSVLDVSPRGRGLSSEQRTVLSRLAAQVVVELELRREAIERTDDLCRLQKQFDDAPMLLSVVSPRDYKFEYANRKLRVLLKDEALTKKTVQDVLSNFPSEPFLESLRQTCKSGRGSKGRNIPFRSSNSDAQYINYDHEPALDQSGHFYAVVTVAVDVTDEHVSRQQAERLRFQLDQARQLSTIGIVSATIAHELNQPLSAAANYAATASALLKSNSADTVKAEKMVSAAVSQIQRAGTLIQRVREMASGQAPEVKTTSLKSCIRRVKQILRASGRSLTIRTSLQGRDRVLVDPTQIEQVFLNLFTNSLEALRASGHEPSVEVSTVDAGQFVKVEVRDRGPGIPGAVFEHLFEPFHGSRTQGMGLGLAIVRSIVESYGGGITAINDNGAVFRFTLPARSVSTRAGANKLRI